jgi:peptidoglycan/LPS O-acetylase OafA/YrhL
MQTDGVLSAPLASRGGELKRLTSLRAIAALMVFADHIVNFGIWSGLPGTAEGHLGVTFFFVLSGFILVWAASPGMSAWTFYRKRFARIYPAYFVMLVVAAAAPIAVDYRSVLAGVLAATLTQAFAGHDASLVFCLNGVSWSLSCEAFFYLLFPVIIFVLRDRGWRWLVATFVLSCIVSQVSVRLGQNSYASPLVRLPEFVLGMVVGIAFARGWSPRIPLGPTIGITILLYVAVSLHPIAGVDTEFAVPFAAVILASARLDAEGRPGRLASRWMVYAGEVSFCFYLVHEQVLFVLKPLLPAGPATAVLVLGVSGICAAALHHVVEVPCQRLLSRRRRQAVPASQPLPPEPATRFEAVLAAES